VELYARGEGQPAPRRALQRGVRFGGLRTKREAAALRAVERPPNLVQRPPGFLHRFYAEELIEVLGAVMVSATDPEGRREQSFLNVVADRTARDAAEIRKIADGILGDVHHKRLI
jgi:hypothetical protein